MLIGHLPAGYFVTRSLIKKLKLPFNNWWFLTGLVASVLPDFDFAYYLLFNQTGSSHRNYLSHYSMVYLTIAILFIIIYLFYKKRWLKAGIIIVFANIFVHLVLDTVFVGVKWLWPFYDHLIGIYNVNFTGGILVENYFVSWYWYLEIVLWILAIVSVAISYKKGELK